MPSPQHPGFLWSSQSRPVRGRLQPGPAPASHSPFAASMTPPPPAEVLLLRRVSDDCAAVTCRLHPAGLFHLGTPQHN